MSGILQQSGIVADRELQRAGELAQYESTYDARKEWEDAVKSRQELVTLSEKISWAHHGKDEFDGLVQAIYQRNHELRDLIPKLQLPKPFDKIRGGLKRPHLWGETREVRKALENLNVTLRRINLPTNNRTLKVTIRLEEDHDETRRFFEEKASFFTQLPLRNNPLAFRLATYFQRASRPVGISQVEILICSTISKASGTEIGNLPEKLQSIEISIDDSDQFAEVGHLMPTMPDFRNTWSVFREVRTNKFEWLSEGTLEDFIDSGNFTPYQRIYLAAKVATAHLLFAAINRGFAHRQLKSYRYFRQSADKSHDWTIPFVNMPWLDYGFGSPVPKTGDRIRLNAPAQEAPAKIDPAIDLGVLLYQITSCKRLQYENTDSALMKAGEEARKSLDKILSVCGLPVMEIVETCFETCPPDKRTVGGEDGQDPAFVVIEEVAPALNCLAKKFKEKESVPLQ